MDQENVSELSEFFSESNMAKVLPFFIPESIPYGVAKENYRYSKGSSLETPKGMRIPKAPPVVWLSTEERIRVEDALDAKGKVFQSAHKAEAGRVVILCYRVLDDGERSHGRYYLDKLVPKVTAA